MKSKFTILVALLLVLFTSAAWADNSVMSAVKLITNDDGSQEYSVSLQILAMMTALSFIPAALIMMTSFTRIIIVLSILRQALGLQQSPSNQVLVGITLFLSFFIMSPVFERINDNALQPYLNEELTSLQAFDQAKLPMQQFMLAQTRVTDIDTFMRIAKVEADSPEEVPFRVLIPAFVTSELKTDRKSVV